MQVLILNWRDPKNPLAGGAEIMLQKHAQYWKKMGAEVTWFASAWRGAKEREKYDGILYIRKGSHYTVHLWAFIYYLKGKLPADIVIDCFHFLPFFTPLYMKKIKIFALIHEVAKDVWYKNLPFILAYIGYRVEPLFFRLYKDVPFLTVSNSTKNELEKIGIPSDHIEIVYNGIDIPRVKKTTRSKIPIILYLGRIAEDKGIKDAISAYESVYKKDKGVVFWIAGKEQSNGYLKELLKNKIGNISYLGFVSEKKKFELLQKSWILIHPSTREGWGLTVIEAASQGTPTVGYDVVGLRDSILNGKTGILTKSNPNALVSALTQLIKDKKKYYTFSKNCLRWARQFDWEKSVRSSWKIIKTYEL